MDHAQAGEIPKSIQQRTAEVHSKSYVILSLEPGLFVVLRSPTDPERSGLADPQDSIVVVTVGRDSEVTFDA